MLILLTRDDATVSTTPLITQLRVLQLIILPILLTTLKKTVLHADDSDSVYLTELIMPLQLANVMGTFPATKVAKCSPSPAILGKRSRNGNANRISQ